MKRREFIAGLGAAAWPLGAQAQRPGKPQTIGYLGESQQGLFKRLNAAFLGRLHELGWIEGRNIAIEYRWAEGGSVRSADIATEFVDLKVDVILALGSVNALAAKRATSVIPIVFPVAGDPVGLGLVASLARPGGNVTGLTNQLTDLAGKRIGLLHQVVPGLRRLAIMVYSSPLGDLELGEVQMASGMLGLELIIRKIRRTEDIALAFDALKDRADALYIANSGFFMLNEMLINTSALRARLPTMFGEPSWVAAAGLMAYGASFLGQFRRSAEFVDRILRGTKPADIPVEQPTRFELVINLKTAKTLGLTVPPTLLAAFAGQGGGDLLMIGRREFVILLGGTAVAWPLEARAQQPAMPVIGFLDTGPPEATAGDVAAFRRGLTEGGFVEGRDVTIEYRWALGHYDRLPALAAELVRSGRRELRNTWQGKRRCTG